MHQSATPTGIARWVPLAGWSRRYPRELLRGDVIAGLTVAVMLIPQGMAYASLAGMPPVTGLYAAIVGIVAYAVFGTSGSLAVGPVAITSLLTLEGLSRVTDPADPSYPAVAALLALLVGGLLLIAGIARLGFLVNFLSHPVISGFTSAAAITIAASQIKDLLGIDIGRPDGVIETLRLSIESIADTNRWTLAIGLAAIVVLAAGKKLKPRFPTALLVLVVSTGLTWALDLTSKGVAVLGEVPTGFPTPTMPDASGSLFGDLLPVAATIAIVAYAEGVSVAKAIARRTRERIDANQELIATGAANVAASAFGGFPVAGGFSRTAVNHQSGARTPLASLITAVVLGISVLWLTPLLEYLPKAVLAAVVMVAVFGLIDVAGARETFRTSRPDFWALAVTFAATLVIGVEPGLAIGLVFSLLVFVARSSTPHATELGRVEGSTEYRNVDRYPTVTHDHVALLRMDGPLFFANTKFLADRVGAITRERPELRDVVLDASAIGAIDASGLHALHELHDDLEASGVHLHLATVRGPVRDALDRSELRQVFDGRIHANLHDAVMAVGGDGCPLCAPDPTETPTAVL